MRSLCLSILILFSLKSQACEIALPEDFSLAASPKEKSFFAYTPNRSLEEIPSFRAFNCQKLAASNKFLMIALGPQNDEFTDRFSTYDFANNYTDSGCYIANSRFKQTQNFTKRNQLLQERWNLLKSCVEVHVEEENNIPLSVPNNQPGCKFSKTGSYKMSFNTGFCFVKPNIASSYIIRLRLKPECLTYQRLGELNIKISDLRSTLNFYSSGDATGTSIDLNAIKTFVFRTSIAPMDQLITPSEDFGVLSPQFPANYGIPDIHTGSPEAADVGGKNVRLRLPVWVDNQCDQKCKDGFCQSVCDYAQPIAGNVELFELDTKTGNTEFLTSWYDGGVVQPHFQGEIAGTGIELSGELFKPGLTYQAKISYNDPKFDFERLKNRLSAKIQRMDQKIPPINLGQISSIPETPILMDIQKLPYIESIRPLNFQRESISSVERAVRALRNYLGFKLWPPYFDKLCSINESNCEGIKDNYLELIINFKIGDYDQETHSYKIEVLKAARKSKFVSSYQELNPAPTYKQCPF